VQGRTVQELPGLLHNFVELVNRHQDQHKLVEIVSLFQEIWERTAGELSAVLQSARPWAAASKTHLINYLEQRTGAQQVKLVEKIDLSLIGGFILNYNNRIIDGSVASSLAALQEKISN
jgi:F-type H+-transporting ATPase subunit delta